MRVSRGMSTCGPSSSPARGVEPARRVGAEAGRGIAARRAEVEAADEDRVGRADGRLDRAAELQRLHAIAQQHAGEQRGLLHVGDQHRGLGLELETAAPAGAASRRTRRPCSPRRITELGVSAAACVTGR